MKDEEGSAFEAETPMTKTTGCLTVLFWMFLAGVACGIAMAAASGIFE